MMRVAVLAGPGQFEVREAALPAPGPNEVRIKLEGCGVCGSNGPVWEGRPWFTYPCDPGAPGHEGWGRVDALGPGVSDRAIGDRVTLLSYRAYAEYDVAPSGSLVPLPTELDSLPFPGEALGCAMNVFRRSDIRPGQNVAVVGVGFLGALLVQMAARSGARVAAVSRRPFALTTARSFGAEDTLPLEPGVGARLRERTGAEQTKTDIEVFLLAEAPPISAEVATEIQLRHACGCAPRP